MKKQYLKPIVEKIEFDYTNVISTSGCRVGGSTYNQSSGSCSVVETWAGQSA